jgi:peroxiredoxin
MSLREQLDCFRDTFISEMPPEVIRAIARGDEEIVSSGLAQRALRAGDVAPDFALLDSRGETVSLSRLRKSGPVVLSFYRGDWCPYCNIELDALAVAHPEIRGMGASVVAVSPQKAQRATVSRQFPFSLVSDPGSKVAKAYGIAFELPRLLRPLYEEFGHPLPAVNDTDDWTLPVPATYVVDDDGRIAMSFVDADYRHRIEPSEITAALVCLQDRGGR